MAECPILYKVPKKINPVEKMFTKETTLLYYVYEFKVPWQDIKKKEESEHLVKVFFKSGIGVSAREKIKEGAVQVGVNSAFLYFDESIRCGHIGNLEGGLVALASATG